MHRGSIQLDDPVRDLVNDCIESIELYLQTRPWDRETFTYHSQPLFATLTMFCPDTDIRCLAISGYLLAALDRPRLAAEKVNGAGILNLERERE